LVHFEKHGGGVEMKSFVMELFVDPNKLVSSSFSKHRYVDKVAF